MSVSDIKNNYQHSREIYVNVSASRLHKNFVGLFDKCASKVLNSTVYEGGKNIEVVAQPGAYIDVFINIASE